jgi:hypothetical protein
MSTAASITKHVRIFSHTFFCLLQDLSAFSSPTSRTGTMKGSLVVCCIAGLLVLAAAGRLLQEGENL